MKVENRKTNTDLAAKLAKKYGADLINDARTIHFIYLGYLTYGTRVKYTLIGAMPQR